MSLLDTSAKEVEISWMCLNLAKETDPGMYGIMLMKGVSYLLGDFIIFSCIFSMWTPRLICSVLHEMVHQ